MTIDLEGDLRREFNAATPPSSLTFNPESVMRQGSRSVRRRRIVAAGSAAMAVAVVATGASLFARPDDKGQPQPASSTAVTVTPTVTAKVTQPRATATTTRAAGVPNSDVVGRKFDLGTIVRVEDDGGVPVIILDRWTAIGVSDSTLAANGVPINPHTGVLYQNLNSKSRFRIPVAQGAVFTYNRCVWPQPPPTDGFGADEQQRSSTLQEFSGLPDSGEGVVLLSLDPKGQVISAQNDPSC
jgi:hypothetical protein